LLGELRAKQPDPWDVLHQLEKVDGYHKKVKEVDSHEYATKNKRKKRANGAEASQHMRTSCHRRGFTKNEAPRRGDKEKKAPRRTTVKYKPPKAIARDIKTT